MIAVNHAKVTVTAAIHALFAILDFQRVNSMDKLHQLKRITWRLKAEQYAKMLEARAAKKDFNTIAKIYSTIIGIKMVYNQILLIEKKSIIESDETPEEIWQGEHQETF